MDCNHGGHLLFNPSDVQSTISCMGPLVVVIWINFKVMQMYKLKVVCMKAPSGWKLFEKSVGAIQMNQGIVVA